MSAAMEQAHSAVVEIRGLNTRFGAAVVHENVSLTVRPGEIFALVGASGCGKSTLLRLIGGQEKPAQGSVKVAGQLVHELDTDSLYQLRRKMGMMFQAGGLFTDLSVYENVAFPLRENSDLPEELIRSLILMKLHVVGLRGARNLMPSELSGGMARRVALARAIVHDPMLAMYDEPFAGLDPISLNVIADLIRRLNDALGTTSIIVTYDVSESLKLVDYLYVIADGVVVGEGTPEAMLDSDNPVVHQFIHAEPDGPIAFHYPAQPIAQQLGLK